jgi:hypothetical protein
MSTGQPGSTGDAMASTVEDRAWEDGLNPDRTKNDMAVTTDNLFMRAF